MCILPGSGLPASDETRARSLQPAVAAHGDGFLHCMWRFAIFYRPRIRCSKAAHPMSRAQLCSVLLRDVSVNAQGACSILAWCTGARGLCIHCYSHASHRVRGLVRQSRLSVCAALCPEVCRARQHQQLNGSWPDPADSGSRCCWGTVRACCTSELGPHVPMAWQPVPWRLPWTSRSALEAVCATYPAMSIWDHRMLLKYPAHTLHYSRFIMACLCRWASMF